MDQATDTELLQEYVALNSESAFAALVARHMSLVYSAALRKTGNPHAAEEIAQVVFVILAIKAGRISGSTILPGWLYQTTRFTAASYLKSELRRARREQNASMQMESSTSTTGEAWQQLAPFLEDAMGQLAEKDRSAVVLRFFGGKSFAEVAAAAGVSENAAKKRVQHALEKLQQYFSNHGISSTTAVISAAISTHSVPPAPVLLAKAVTAAALAKGATASVSTSIVIKGALKIMAWTKMKTAVVIGVIGVVLFVAVGTARMAQSNQESHSRLHDARQLALAMILAADSHNGKLPSSFNQSQSWIGTDPNIFSTNLVSDWEIVSGGNLNTLPNVPQTILLREKVARHVGHGEFAKAYAFADGHTDLLYSKTEDFSAVEKQRGYLVQPSK